jgi:hypothetical protein
LYEAVTLTLAKKMGLRVPRYFVLLNDGNVNFSYNYPKEEVSKVEKQERTKPFYYLSELIPSCNEEKESKRLAQLMSKEKIYRDLLMLADVSGRKNNFCLIITPQDAFVLYIDLGCSFVDAHDGVLTQRNYIQNLLGNNDHSMSSSVRKKIKNAERFLKNKYIISNPPTQEIINLLDFSESVNSMQIPLFPKGKVNISAVMDQREIEEITSLLKINFEETIRDHKRKGTSLDILIEE